MYVVIRIIIAQVVANLFQFVNILPLILEYLPRPISR